ncbi:MAG: hypothetical protein R3362_05470 [Rhodothermales bacterium]|nr:hypothetical protein [Rhodothermales bacterium]
MQIVVILAAMLLFAFWAYLDHRQKMAGKGVPSDVDRTLAALTERLEAAEAERERLTQRVQNLEAIVTTETFDLARENPEAARARLELPEEPEETPEARAERLARRVRP